MSALRRKLQHWADKIEAERTAPLTFTITTARGTVGPFTLER